MCQLNICSCTPAHVARTLVHAVTLALAQVFYPKSHQRYRITTFVQLGTEAKWPALSKPMRSLPSFETRRTFCWTCSIVQSARSLFGPTWSIGCSSIPTLSEKAFQENFSFETRQKSDRRHATSWNVSQRVGFCTPICWFVLLWHALSYLVCCRVTSQHLSSSCCFRCNSVHFRHDCSGPGHYPETGTEADNY